MELCELCSIFFCRLSLSCEYKYTATPSPISNAFHLPFFLCAAIMSSHETGQRRTAISFPLPSVPVAWNRRDVLLFANSIGCQLDEPWYLYVSPGVVLPSLAAVFEGFNLRLPNHLFGDFSIWATAARFYFEIYQINELWLSQGKFCREYIELHAISKFVS